MNISDGGGHIGNGTESASSNRGRSESASSNRGREQLESYKRSGSMSSGDSMSRSSSEGQEATIPELGSRVASNALAGVASFQVDVCFLLIFSASLLYFHLFSPLSALFYLFSSSSLFVIPPPHICISSRPLFLY